MNGPNPDPHALAIARAVQEEVAPDTVILFGSRAAGDHRPDSDLDLLVITAKEDHLSAKIHAEHAALRYMDNNPPELELGVISMNQETFQRCSLANMHIAGQATMHGVVMSGENLERRTNYQDNYPAHWPETSRRIRRAETSSYNLNQFVDADYYDKTLVGHTAERAIEHALKGWLSSHQDTGRYGHAIDAAWRKIQELEDWTLPHMQDLRAVVQEVFDYTTFPDPGPNSPERTSNWLIMYANIYDYTPTEHEMTRVEEHELRERVTMAVAAILDRVHQISGTGDDDVLPDRKKTLG